MEVIAAPPESWDGAARFGLSDVRGFSGGESQRQRAFASLSAAGIGFMFTGNGCLGLSGRPGRSACYRRARWPRFSAGWQRPGPRTTGPGRSAPSQAAGCPGACLRNPPVGDLHRAALTWLGAAGFRWPWSLTPHLAPDIRRSWCGMTFGPLLLTRFWANLGHKAGGQPTRSGRWRSLRRAGSRFIGCVYGRCENVPAALVTTERGD
jgi:hypothetical protein